MSHKIFTRNQVALFVSSLIMSTFAIVVVNQPTPANAAVASVDQNRWYTMTFRHSGLRIDVRNGGTANGTALQQYTANTTKSQQFRFVSAGSGYYRIISRLSTNKVWDAAGGTTGNGTKVQIWTWTGVKQQQWMPVVSSNGYVVFKPRHASTKCLDVPAASKATGRQLQLYSCNGTQAQQVKLTKGAEVYPTAGACNAFTGAKQLGKYKIAGRYLPVCGPRPAVDNRYDKVYPYKNAPGYYWGYQCTELVSRWLWHKYGAAETSGNGANKVDAYARKYGSKFVRYSNGTQWHAPAPGDVISFSARSDFVSTEANQNFGHTGVVIASSVNSAGNGTVTMASQNDGAATGQSGYHTYQVNAWRVQDSGLPYIKWLHAR